MEYLKRNGIKSQYEFCASDVGGDAAFSTSDQHAHGGLVHMPTFCFVIHEESSQRRIVPKRLQ